MANVYSDGYNNLNAVPPVKEKANKDQGRIRIWIDTYTQGASDGSIGDVINMKPLPEGANILAGKLIFGTGNTSETLECGITGSAAKFLAATAAATAGTADMLAHLTATPGALYEVPAGGVNVIITNGTAAIKAAQGITAIFYYTLD